MAELQNSSSEFTTGLLLNKDLFEEDFGYGCVMTLTLEAHATVRTVTMKSVKTQPAKKQEEPCRTVQPAECQDLEENLMGKEAMQLEAKEEMKRENRDGNSNSACTHVRVFSS